MKRLFLLSFTFAIVALAAEVSGTWKATAEGPNGTMERTFVFKVDGNKLTGEADSPMLGKSTLMDGKVDGDKVSFTLNVKFGDNEMKVSYQGKITGDEIQLTAKIGDGGQTIEWKGKRVK